VINGLLLPGGGADLTPGHPFYDAASTLVNMAIKVGRAPTPAGVGAGIPAEAARGCAPLPQPSSLRALAWQQLPPACLLLPGPTTQRNTKTP
jgi:hypothetical protein